MEMILQTENRKHPIAGSAFSYQRKPLSYMKYVPDGKDWGRLYKKASWQHKEPYAKDLLKIAYRANDNIDAIIPIWKIRGPILLLGSKNDSMTLEIETIASFKRQLAAHHFSYLIVSHIYPHISHLIVPFKPYSTKLFKTERQDPLGCAKDRGASWYDTLHFLKNKW